MNISSTMVYADNCLRSAATDLFEQYLELLKEKANQYFDSVLEEF